MLIIPKSYAQYYNAAHISTKNGLPNNSIQDIFEDRQGQIWLGTNAGLCRYNGKDIEVFTSKDGLSGNYVWGIAQDKKGWLWLATYGNGISYYDGHTFHQLQMADSISKRVRNVVYDADYDLLLFGTDHGLIVKSQDSIKYFNKKSVGFKHFQVIAMHKIGGLYYIYTYWWQPTMVYNPKDGSLKVFGKHAQRGFVNIASGIVNNAGDTIIGYGRDSTAILQHNNTIKYGNTGQVFDMEKGAGDDVWLAGWDISMSGATGGLFRVNHSKIIDFTDSLKIDSRHIWSLYYDTLERVLFVGTNDKGLYIYKNTLFRYYDLEEKEVRINDLKHFGNQLYIASEQKVYIFENNRITQQFDKKYFEKQFANTKYDLIQQFYKSDKAKLSALYFNTDEQQNIYVSTYGGFYRYNADGRFKLINYTNTPFVFFENRLYTVGWGKLYEYKDCEFRVDDTIMHSYKKEEAPIDVNRIVKHKNHIWFLSWSQGLFVMDSNAVFTNFNKHIHGLDNRINDIAFDSDDNIYIAQNNGEILIARYDDDVLQIKQRLSCGNEIKGNVIKWIACNKQNQLFVGTDYGLNYVNINQQNDSNWVFRFYNQDEGYTCYESSVSSVDQQGNVWVNTAKGLLEIKAKGFDIKHVYQSLKITSISLYSSPVDSLLSIINPKLSYNQNYLSFHFDRNNFTAADKDIYYYRLLGLSDDWRVSMDNAVDFFDLSSGNYTFEVKCYNSNNATYSQTVHYKFKIREAWWNALWFYAIIVLLIAVAVWYYIRLRIRKITRQAVELASINKKIAEMEMQALQSQMNPHFVFNSINAIQYFVLDENIDDTLTYLDHFSKLLRATLNYASEKYITIQQEKDFLNHYLALEQMRFVSDEEKAFEIELIIDEQIDLHAKIMPPMLLQPLIENAIKHGEIHKVEDGKISIEIKIQGDMLLCIITDNGIGRAKSSAKKNKQHHSKGMGIVEDRIKLLSKSGEAGMEIIDLERGTQIVLRIVVE